MKYAPHLRMLFAALAAWCVFTSQAAAQCYLNLPIVSGFDRAGPYANLQQCQAYAERMNVEPSNCSCGSSGPSPQQLQHYYQRQKIKQHIDTGNQLFDQQRYAEAISAYEQALAVGPSDTAQSNIRLARFNIAFARGWQLHQARDYAGAIAAYQEALSYSPKDPTNTLNKIRYAQAGIAFDRGQALFAARDWDGAIAAYREALSYDPGYEAARNNIASAEQNKANKVARQQRESQYRSAFNRIQGGIDDFITAARTRKSQARPTILSGASAPDVMQSSKALPVLVFGDIASLENAHRDAASFFDTPGALLGVEPSPPIHVPTDDLPPFEAIPAQARDDPRIDPMIKWYYKLAADRAKAQENLDELLRQTPDTEAALPEKKAALTIQIKRIETDQKTATKTIKHIVRNSYGEDWNEEGVTSQ